MWEGFTGSKTLIGNNTQYRCNMNFDEVVTMILDKYEPTEVVDMLLESGVLDEEILESMEDLIVDRLELFMYTSSGPEDSQDYEDMSEPLEEDEW
jgi:hypothetical protein